MASEAPETWAELKTEIETHTNRADLTARVPSWIALFESHAQREIFVPDRETAADLTLNEETEALPSGLQKIISLHLTTDPKTILEQMSLVELRSRYTATTTGKPEHYALRGNNLILAPSPDATYTGKLVYIAGISPLNSVTTSNWLLADHPDVYVQGTLFEAWQEIGAEEEMRIAKARRDEIIESINSSGIRRSHGGPPQRIRAPIVV